ncbi:hypothetical protein H072_6967 [Dactylellina haptotyla CBS 200.50]|uniref:Glycine cleavage system H protein n=1 Tax=Dactylellina haptotyla (strain CBS 200.50) TaxID=1284197 RepID=S8BIV1_DACHA|nr:hypothetical protein H072_6967 [Dactylellina haptotyla CBS 200.50]
MASTLRIASRALPRISGAFSRAALPARVLSAPLSRREFSRTAGRFEIIKKYTQDHEWVSLDTDTGIATVGITDYAQDQLGEVVFVELPGVGEIKEAGDSIGAVESVKSASDIISPLSGTIVEENAVLGDSPTLINSEAETGEGWVVKIQVTDRVNDELKDLMDAEAYADFTSK